MIFLGDSIVDGYQVSPAQRFSTLVATQLGLTEINKGIGGSVLQNSAPAQTNNGRDRYALATLGNNAGRAIIEFGINDCLMGAADFTPANFQNDAREIIEGYVKLGMARSDITLLSPPYVNPTAWATATTAPYNAGSDAKYTQYRQAAAAAASATSVRYVDIYQAMVSAGGNATLQADGFHPNAAGHRAIADAIIAALT